MSGSPPPPGSLGPLLGPAARAFDRVDTLWESPWTRRRTADGLALLFLGALGVVELRRWGLLPEAIATYVPESHFAALAAAFTALLLVETVALVLALADSIAGSVGKQFELFSLILLRDAFKALGALGEPVEWSTAQGPVIEALADGAGALVVFAGVVLYGRLQRHRRITSDEREQARFVAVKKAIALGLLLAIAVAGVDDARRYLTGADPYPFFDRVFTALIFADVLLVLVSLRYTSTYAVVFRNAGFTLATVLLRLALVAPVLAGVGIGIGATGFVVALSWIYNQTPVERPRRTGGEKPQPADAAEPGSGSPVG